MVYKGNESGCSFTTQSLCNDIGRANKNECRCLTIVECDNHMNASNGYNCTTTICKGKACKYCYNDQPMCEETECEEQIEDSCNDELCNGTAYAFKNKEQPLCEDIACEDQTEGRYMTKNKCK